MRVVLQLVVSACAAAVISGCGGTVNYNPGNPDTTPPGVNLLITRGGGLPDIEVQERMVPPGTPPLGDYGNPAPKQRFEFSILATATDNESGIRNITLTLTRTVCFQTANGVSQSYSGSKTMKEANWTDRTNAPTQPSLGYTGVIDNTTPANIADENLLMWINTQGTRSVGVGVSTRWHMSATNFAGTTTSSDVIFISAGDVSCVTDP